MRAGDKILDAEGYGLVFRKTAADTDGELLEVDAYYRPQSTMPPRHYHPQQEEEFTVVRGEFRVLLGDELHTYHRGDTFRVPAGISHSMHNVADHKGHLVWRVRPALNSEGLLAVTWKMERDRQSMSLGLREILHLAVILQAYREELRLSSGGQRLLLQLAAPLARLLGFKPTYER